VDINGDGLFSFDEFVEIVSNYSGNTSGGNTNEEQELRDAFRVRLHSIIQMGFTVELILVLYSN